MEPTLGLALLDYVPVLLSGLGLFFLFGMVRESAFCGGSLRPSVVRLRTNLDGTADRHDDSGEPYFDCRSDTSFCRTRYDRQRDNAGAAHGSDPDNVRYDAPAGPDSGAPMGGGIDKHRISRVVRLCSLPVV